MVISKYSLIGAILQYHPETISAFSEMGLGCVRCPSSARETLEQACNVHGMDLDAVIEKLNSAIVNS
ncbi:MAG: DUF1858 domain-containing protein [Lachnospiraceae bacterium]|nr:DUF1858 domain-containing protein [Lachnospiraceae bacterium]